MKPTIAVVVPGFGQPHWDIKQRVLTRNVCTLTKNANWDVRFFVSQYSDFDRDIEWPAHVSATVSKERGVLVENVVRHARPDGPVGRCDYVMVLLDDVVLETAVDLDRWAALLRATGCHILSPCLSKTGMSFWDYMTHRPGDPVFARKVAACELFCYFMPSEAYARYFSFMSPDNPWMWGMDFMLHYKMGLTALLVNAFKMAHLFPSGGSKEAQAQCDQYLEGHGTSMAKLRALPWELGCVVTANSTTV